ncbi:acyltransferase family protein [Sphingomonas oryzagri]
MAERQRLDGLDGLRGLAAFLVLLHHAGPKVAGLNLLPGGYLAVDFFFMLSGFVIARGYEGRLRDGLTLGSFLLLRLRRLYPMIGIGILAGAVVAVLRGLDTGEAIIRLGIQALFLPLPSGDASTFPLDGVEWSLMFELIANSLHATIFWRLGNRQIALFTGVMFCALLIAGTVHGSLALGDRGNNLWGGFPRILFSYGAGMIVWRCARDGRLPSVRLSAATICILFSATLLLAGFLSQLLPGGPIELLLVATVFPLVLIAGIGLQLKAPTRYAATLAGEASYPLYAVHLPIIDGGAMLFRHHEQADGLYALTACITAALLSAFVLARFDAWRQRFGTIAIHRRATTFSSQIS